MMNNNKRIFQDIGNIRIVNEEIHKKTLKDTLKIQSINKHQVNHIKHELENEVFKFHHLYHITS